MFTKAPPSRIIQSVTYLVEVDVHWSGSYVIKAVSFHVSGTRRRIKKRKVHDDTV